MRRLPAFVPFALALGCALSAGGCYFTRSPSRPLPALLFSHPASAPEAPSTGGAAAHPPCLVIFIPGFLDGPDTYREHGFPSALVRSGAACDSVAVDLHFRYYGEGRAADILYEDVLAPAVGRGYEEIWLVGISMGGLGTMMLARAHPELIDGVVLLSPFLGEESFVREVAAAGGLAAWHPPSPMPAREDTSTYSTFLWAWFRGYVEDPDSMPPTWIGWANGERLAPVAQLFAAALPESHTLARDGAHNWATWRPLFADLLQRAQPGRGRAARAR